MNKTVKKIFFPHMSVFQCDQLNEGVNKLIREPFLCQNLHCGNICVYHRGYLFYFHFMEAYYNPGHNILGTLQYFS